MKRHNDALAASVHGGSEERPPAGLAEQVAPTAGEITIAQSAELARATPRRGPRAGERRAAKRAAHKLVLIGELDRASTHTLEAEIERLCASGVGSITLDLSELTGIDSAGVAVLAFRSRWCRKRGCELALIPGPAPVQRAFERAGVAGSLTFREEDATAL
jgi:anti-anti-sigma factor